MLKILIEYERLLEKWKEEFVPLIPKMKTGMTDSCTLFITCHP